MRIVEWPDAKVLGRQERLNSMLKPGYVPFYRGARRWIREALERGERFDVAHQLLPVAMRYPSPAAGLGIPFFIGPVGGSLENPPGFADDTAPWYMRLRGVDRLRLRHDPLLRRTYERADCVLGIAPYVLDNLDGVHIRRFEVMSETGLTSCRRRSRRGARTGPSGSFTWAGWSGRRACRTRFRALGRLTASTPMRLDVVGRAIDREATKALVADSGSATPSASTAARSRAST